MGFSPCNNDACLVMGVILCKVPGDSAMEASDAPAKITELDLPRAFHSPPPVKL